MPGVSARAEAPHPREILGVQDQHCIILGMRADSDEEMVPAKHWATSEVRKRQPH